jgi:hypothetical protein
MISYMCQKSLTIENNFKKVNLLKKFLLVKNCIKKINSWSADMEIIALHDKEFIKDIWVTPTKQQWKDKYNKKALKSFQIDT